MRFKARTPANQLDRHVDHEYLDVVLSKSEQMMSRLEGFVAVVQKIDGTTDVGVEIRGENRNFLFEIVVATDIEFDVLRFPTIETGVDKEANKCWFQEEVPHVVDISPRDFVEKLNNAVKNDLPGSVVLLHEHDISSWDVAADDEIARRSGGKIECQPRFSVLDVQISKTQHHLAEQKEMKRRQDFRGNDLDERVRVATKHIFEESQHSTFVTFDAFSHHFDQGDSVKGDVHSVVTRDELNELNDGTRKFFGSEHFWQPRHAVELVVVVVFEFFGNFISSLRAQGFPSGEPKKTKPHRRTDHQSVE